MSNYVLHEYDPDPATRRCRWTFFRKDGVEQECGSTQRSSVMHDDCESDFRQSHDHGGGDCMCFEFDEGPSYHEVMRMTCYPTPEELAARERAFLHASVRNRRINALSNGKAITRLGQRLSGTSSDEEIHRYIRRATNLNRWGVRA